MNRIFFGLVLIAFLAAGWRQLGWEQPPTTAADWTRDATRAYLHEPDDLHRILTDAGFRRREVDRTLVWQVALYVRPQGREAGGRA